MSVIAGFMVPHPPLIVPKIGRGGEAVIEARHIGKFPHIPNPNGTACTDQKKA